MSRYIHGTHREEQDRLAKLNEVMNEACLAELSLPRGCRIIDVGSGLGQFTRRMAASCAGSALGMENSKEQLVEAQRLATEAGDDDLVEFRGGDAANLPLSADERGSFDLAHARFLLEHVDAAQRVVYQMVQAVKPGGRIVLMDDDHELLRIWPHAPGFMAVWNGYVQTYSKMGTDPFIGRKLPELLHRAGALPVRAKLINFGACRGQELFEDLCANMTGLIEGASQLMLSLGTLDESTMNIGMREFEEWRRCDYAHLVYGAMWAEGERLG